MVAAGQGQHVRIVRAEQTTADTKSAVSQLLTKRRPPEAIFCWTDYIALKALGVAKELGHEVPDPALVGYDNTMECDFLSTGLTSVISRARSLGLYSTPPAHRKDQGPQSSRALLCDTQPTDPREF